MESVFYKYGHKKRFPVTYLFLELFGKSVEKSGGEGDIESVLLPVLSALKIKPPYHELMIQQILNDMEEIQKFGSEKPPESSNGKRTFGKEFIKWFSSLDIEKNLLLLSDYDFNKAYKLYSETPVLAIAQMTEVKLGYEWAKAEASFEAVIFGMGGSISGGSDTGNTIDMTKETTDSERQQQEAAIKRMGF